jgi:prolyl oligopeptidase
MVTARPLLVLRLSSTLRHLPALLLLPALLVAAASVAAEELPKAPVRNVDDTYFGTAVHDPYRYFENTKDPEVAAWMKAQSDHAHAVLTLDRRTRRAAEEDRDAGRCGRRTRGRRPARRRRPLVLREARRRDNQYKLYVRQGSKGAETLLVDPETMEKKTGKPYAINFYMPSPDGRYVVYGMSEGGSESATLHVLDVATRHPVGEPVTRADFGYPDWAPDSRSFNFIRMQELKPGMPDVEKYQRSNVWRYRLADGKPGAQPVFGSASPGSR